MSLNETLYTRDELETLFNDTVYPHVIKTGGKIAAYYKHKHREDYEDILQLISMDMWRVLERLLLISDNSDSFLRILTSAINFSFRTHYGKLKKVVYIPGMNTISLDDFEIEQPSDINKLNILLDISDVHKKILALSEVSNRFRNSEKSSILFCLKSILLGREPSKKIISTFYGVEDASFILDYTKYLLRLSLQTVYEEMRR